MDGISAAASVLAIASAGIEVLIKLTSFSIRVGTAPDRIRSIGSDVALTSNVLQQLGELLEPKVDDDNAIDIFSPRARLNTQASADACRRIFRELECSLRKASKQIRSKTSEPGGIIVLLKLERLRWPFLQASFEDLRADLRDARETLMLILHVTTLGYHRKRAQSTPNSINADDQAELVAAIIALTQSKNVARTKFPTESRNQDKTEDVIEIPQDKDSSISATACRSQNLEDSIRLEKSPKANLSILPLPSGTKESSPGRAHDDDDKLTLKHRRDSRDGDNTTQKTKKEAVSEHPIRVLEEWEVVPQAERVEDEEDIHWAEWSVSCLPLTQEEISRNYRKMQRWPRKNLLKQLGRMGYAQRAALDKHMEREKEKIASNEIFLLCISFEKGRRIGISSAEVVLHLLSRRVLVIVQKDFTPNLSHQEDDSDRGGRSRAHGPPPPAAYDPRLAPPPPQYRPLLLLPTTLDGHHKCITKSLHRLHAGTHRK